MKPCEEGNPPLHPSREGTLGRSIKLFEVPSWEGTSKGLVVFCAVKPLFSEEWLHDYETL